MTDTTTEKPIVTVTPTIGDGTVVRWYHADDPIGELPAIEPMLSASRYGVRVGYLHLVPDDLMALAETVRAELSRDSDASMAHLATHRRRGMFGSYEPIEVTA